MDFKKMLQAGQRPLLLLILFGLIANMLIEIEIVGIIAAILMFLAGLAVLGWAGWKAAKTGATAIEGAMTGALVGAVAVIVDGVLFLVIRLLMTLVFGYVEDVPIGLFWGIVGALIALVVLTVSGAICGGLGAYAGKSKKKK